MGISFRKLEDAKIIPDFWVVFISYNGFSEFGIKVASTTASS
jgi:hypothetical protein